MRPRWPHLAHRWHTAHSWHWASMRPRRPRLASWGVARSGGPLIQLHLVAFGCISCRPNPHPSPLPEGEGISPRLRGDDDAGGRRVNDAYDQCKGWRGDGWRNGQLSWRNGQLSLGWGYVWDGVTFGRFANRPYIHTRAGMRGSRLRGNDGAPNPHPHLLPAGEGTYPAFACDDEAHMINVEGWRGDGAMGSCRWVGGYVWDGVTFGRFANRPYIHTRGRDARFPPTRERRVFSRKRRM